MELLLSCDDFVDTKTSINVWNPESGTKIFSYRGPPALRSSLSPICDEGFAIIEERKPFIHFWQTGPQVQNSRRILCPGKPCALDISPDGNYLAVAIEEKINIWQVATGRIVSVSDSAHFRSITKLKFTDDGSYLISGGGDGVVLAWQFYSMVATGSTSSSSSSSRAVKPKHTWSDHSLPITDLHIGAGGCKSQIFTCSVDRTAKIYSLITGQLFLSVSFPYPLTSIVVDLAEYAFYVGSSNGLIYQMKLRTPPRNIEHHIGSTISTSTDSTSTSTNTNEKETDEYLFKKHTVPITALAMSCDGKKLASADESGQIIFWDLSSRQVTRTLATGNGKNKVTNIKFWTGDPENWRKGRKPKIHFPENPKLLEPLHQDQLEFIKVSNRFNSSSVDYSNKINRASSSSNDSGCSHLAEIANLKLELAKAQSLNQELHKYYIDNILDS